MRERLAVVSLESGEVKKIIDDDKMLIEVKNNNQKKWKSKSHFVKLYTNEIANLIIKAKLDAYESGLLLRLIPYLEYESNLIAVDGEFIDKKGIMEISGYSKHKASEVIESLVVKKVLSKTKVGRTLKYHLNPHLMFRGTFLSAETESIFRKEKASGLDIENF